MVQIFVKMDGMKTVTMEVSPEDKVQKILNTVSKSNRDVYVTSGGRILKGSDKLKSCEVRDGSTVEVTSRMRGGGRHKDKKSKSEKKQITNPERPQQKRDGESRSGEGPEMIPMDEVMRWLEESEEFRKNIENVSEGNEGNLQQKVQNFLASIQVSWMNKEQIEHLEGGVWQAVEARRKGRDKQQEQRRQAKQEEKTEQEQSNQGKQVRFGEEQLGKTEADNAGEPELMGRTTEVRTGRGSAGLVRGEDERCRADETSRKGKGKGNGGKGEHEGKGGGFGSKGFQQSVRENEEEWGRVAPNMGAGGSHPQATSDPGKEEKGKKETRVLSWTDCNDEEAKEDEEEVKEEKETGQSEMTDEIPPGLEEVESEPKTQGEEQSQVESEQEAQEEESRRAREGQRRAQEAQEEEKRAQEAREEERRVREAREEEEQRRAREAREDKRGCRKHERKKRRLRRSKQEKGGRLRRSERKESVLRRSKLRA